MSTCWPSIKKSFWGWRHWRKLTLRTPVEDMVWQSLDWNPQKSLRRGQSRRTWWKNWAVESFRFCIKQVHLNKYHQGVVCLGPEVRGEDLSLRRLEFWFAKDEDETLSYTTQNCLFHSFLVQNEWKTISRNLLQKNKLLIKQTSKIRCVQIKLTDTC